MNVLYEEDRAELREKRANGGVFKLDDSDSEEEGDDVKVSKDDVKVEDIWTFDEKTDGNEPGENKKVEDDSEKNESKNESDCTTGTKPEKDLEKKPENKLENKLENGLKKDAESHQNSQTTKNNDSSDDEDGPFAI